MTHLYTLMTFIDLDIMYDKIYFNYSHRFKTDRNIFYKMSEMPIKGK